MKTDNKQSLMIWTIVILAVMNIATISTVLYNRSRAESGEAIVTETSSQTDGTSIRYSGRYFREQLNFNNEQMAMFMEFNPLFRERVRSINNDLNLLRQQMLSEMAEKNCDSLRLSSLSDSIGYLHADLKKATCRYYLEIKGICDQHQQETLKQIFGGMFSGDLPKGRNGKGGEQGRHRGRNSDKQQKQ